MSCLKSTNLVYPKPESILSRYVKLLKMIGMLEKSHNKSAGLAV